MKNRLVPFDYKQAMRQFDVSKRIAEINSHVDRLKIAQAVVDRFEQEEIHELVVKLDTGEIVTLFFREADEDNGIFVANTDLDSGAVTRKQVCDKLLGLECQN